MVHHPHPAQPFPERPEKDLALLGIAGLLIERLFEQRRDIPQQGYGSVGTDCGGSAGARPSISAWRLAISRWRWRSRAARCMAPRSTC